MNHKFKFTYLLLATVLWALPFAAFAQGDAKAGKDLFLKNCASCHNNNMKQKLTGPALAGVEDRWKDYPRADLYAWIRNSQAMIAAGHPRATALWNEYKPTIMQAFAGLTDADIENMLEYIKVKSEGAANDKKDDKKTTEAPVAEEPAGTSWFTWVLLGVLGVVAVVLYRTTAFLENVGRAKAGEAAVAPKTMLQLLTSKSTLGFLSFATVIVAGYLTVENAVALGRQQGYQPSQPIKFSHWLHSGKNKIDCQYCHDAARRSKHSSIPGVSTCINCHAAVENKQVEDASAQAASAAEIMKIYVAAGFDPIKKRYIENFSNYDKTGLDTIFHRWLETKYKDAGLSPAESRRMVDEGYNAAISFFNKPIEWVKIHNLPDHVYFNHSQHVVAGGLQCQTCHGPVQNMQEVYQYSPLSMGWCINCHRKTDVKFTENKYYDSYYEKYHQEMKDGKRSGVTVEDIGGLECQKCHY